MKAGFGREPRWNGDPALVIVDALWSFIGHRRVPALEAVEEYPTACGEAGWYAVENISVVLKLFRELSLPVIYVSGCRRMRNIVGGATKADTKFNEMDGSEFEIPDVIAPIQGETIIEKSKASGFFRTSLDLVLWKLGADTVLIAGSTTSGCIRATAVDSFSSGFEVIVLEDAVWDRSFFSHASSMFDLSMKYAGVSTVGNACHELKTRI